AWRRGCSRTGNGREPLRRLVERGREGGHTELAAGDDLTGAAARQGVTPVGPVIVGAQHDPGLLGVLGLQLRKGAPASGTMAGVKDAYPGTGRQRADLARGVHAVGTVLIVE